jgi:hypothetical protein
MKQMNPSISRSRVKRNFLQACSIAGALTALFASSTPAMAAKPSPNDPVVLWLKGIYQPAVNAPNLGLPGINLNDGTWIVTEIHGVTTVPGSTNQSDAAVGHFYSQTTSALVAYDLPGGAILMQFTEGGWGAPISDGQGGYYYQETWELNILEATGIYSPYTGGHNHMVDRFHSLKGDFLTNPAAGPFDENCYCIISVGGGLPLWWTSNG